MSVSKSMFSPAVLGIYKFMQKIEFNKTKIRILISLFINGIFDTNLIGFELINFLLEFGN